jgi:hypothetical protein
VQASIDAGGALVSEAHAPAWWVLADPEGNELCVSTAGALPQDGGAGARIRRSA